MKTILYVALIFLAALLIVLAPAYLRMPAQPPPPTQSNGENTTQICFGPDCFAAEAVAPEPQVVGGMNTTRLIALINASRLDAGAAMLYMLPQEGVYSLWMKNAYVPTDMVWMASNGTVVSIDKGTHTCAEVNRGFVTCPIIDPGVPARYVAALPAGTADRIGLAVGDNAAFA